LNTLDNNSGTGCPSDPDPLDDSFIAGAQGPGYSDYTTNPALTTTLQAGQTYGCTVFAGEFSEGYAAWIDYNDGETLQGDDELDGEMVWGDLQGPSTPRGPMSSQASSGSPNIFKKILNTVKCPSRNTSGDH
jgi:hypothetical protein